MSSLRRRVEALPLRTTPSICKVPRQLREINNKAYEPEMVAIGPYHHGKRKFKTTEEIKLRYFDSLVQSNSELQVEDYVSAIARMEERARNCYAQPHVNLNSAKFTDMLVLDGCFIIKVIQSSQQLDIFFPFRSSHQILQRDLMLLENQIPFFVLCELFNLIKGPEHHSLLMELVLKFCVDVFPGRVLHLATTRSSNEVKHILDLIHNNWCPPSLYNSIESRQVECCSIPITPSPSRIPCASQLKDANVKFRNKNYNQCTTLFDVEFKNGKMVMPTLVIEDWTESRLRNLIAYEQFLPKKERTPVSDYAMLLDSLINTCKDVQILCHKKIIVNMLGSDNAVVDFVNRLTDRVMLDEKSFIHADIFHRINRHHRRPWNRAVAVFHRDYFNSPWAYIAFLGALLLLLLTVAQTAFSALQGYNKNT